ncbi:MAG: dioxygenase [Planctomycetes bacterium]|nr:dioxygenase [Planctomycetota bacterium]
MLDARTPARAFFLSHGAPELLLRENATTSFWSALGEVLGRPRAFLVASAHWTSAEVLVERGAAPRTIHDFGGFPAELYAQRYPAPGDPALADEIAQRLVDAGIAARTAERGFDHGVWIPLARLRAAADVPVIALSVQPRLDAAHHHAVGRALAPLLEQGCVLVGSGGATHALGELEAREAPRAPWAAEFQRWLRDVLGRGELASGLGWERFAPHARRNHPTVEHLLPLFVAWGGAGAGARGRLLHEAFEHGVLSLAAFAFERTSTPQPSIAP